MEEQVLRLQFYQQLFLLVMKNSSTYPFYALVIESGLSKIEVEEIYELCTKLNNEWEKQKEEGFVTFLPLLNHFVGMLNYKLEPHKTIDALYEQGIYENLMAEFRKIITSA